MNNKLTQKKKKKEHAMLSISDNELSRLLESAKTGLSTQEAEKRLTKYGYNEIEEKTQSWILKFLRGFITPISCLIESAGLLSALIGHWADFIMIMLLLFLNIFIGFIEEKNANKAIKALKSRLAPSAIILRDGTFKKMDSKHIVPGDVIHLHLGDVIPADVQLIGEGFLSIDQSNLTGESLPIEMQGGSNAFSGSVVKQGSMQAIVLRTGANTYFSKTAHLVNKAQNVSHFQKAVMQIGRILIYIAVLLVTILGIDNLIKHGNIVDFLDFAATLLVASIPAALPTVLQVTMVIGAKQLAKQKAIVTHTSAIEELSGMTILCSDKTGTLTQNKLTMEDVIPYGDNQKETVLEQAFIASSPFYSEDIIDNLVYDNYTQFFGKDILNKHIKVEKFTPFNAVDKRAEALYKKQNSQYIATKGAEQVIYNLLDSDEEKEFLDTQNKTFAQNGIRMIAVANKKAKGKWKLSGFFTMIDPPREDSAKTIHQIQALGVEVKMITGDQQLIAKNTCNAIGLGDNILLASELNMSNEEDALKQIHLANGFSGVFPEHKYEIVKLLQEEKDTIVGMTGDGVNDAPALKQANIGIAVEGATDVAKSSADLVLTEPGLTVINNAIVESRKTFQRMENYTIYRIAETIRILAFITICILVFQFYPLNVAMILLLAILNDVAIITIAYDNVKPNPKPNRWDMKYIISEAFLLGMIGVIFSFACVAFAYFGLNITNDQLMTMVYLKLSLAGHFTIFLARERGFALSSKPAPVLILAVVCTQLIALFFSVYGIILPSPIGWGLAGIVIAFVVIEFFVVDLFKVWFNKVWAKKHDDF